MLLRRLLMEEQGQTFVEYGILLLLIVFVVIVALTVFGMRVTNIYNTVNANIND